MAGLLRAGDKAEMTLYFLRHGQTSGNRAKRYLGRTDEPLTPEAVLQVQTLMPPKIDHLYTSPLLRCRQTAQLLYPTKPAKVIPALRECDFGAWEGKTHLDLEHDPQYQAWLMSGGTLPFPEGESRETFHQRTVQALEEILAHAQDEETLFFSIHGGSIMSIMSHLTGRRADDFSFQVANGTGYVCQLQAGHLCSHAYWGGV